MTGRLHNVIRAGGASTLRRPVLRCAPAGAKMVQVGADRVLVGRQVRRTISLDVARMAARRPSNAASKPGASNAT